MIEALKKKKIDVCDVFVAVLIFELVLGGSGRIISIGPVSLRHIILFCAVIVQTVWLFKGKLKKSWQNILLIGVFVIFIANLIYSCVVNDVRSSIDVFLGYISLILSVFFQMYFDGDKKRLDKVINLFSIAALILAVFSLLVWLVALIGGYGTYPVISGLLSRFDYGLLAYVGRIPRLFFKGTIYVCLLLILLFIRLFKEPKNIKLIVMFSICALSVLTSFTVAFVAFIVLIMVYLYFLLYSNDNVKKKLIIFFVGSVGLLFIAYITGVINIFIGRFTGGYTMSLKFIQAYELLKGFMQKPLFGWGIGCSYAINTPTYTISSVYYEVMWCEMLMKLGVLGMIPYVLLILGSIRSLYKLYKAKDDYIYLFLMLGIVFLCGISFSNPFMNNSLGLVFFAICVGASQIKASELDSGK